MANRADRTQLATVPVSGPTKAALCGKRGSDSCSKELNINIVIMAIVIVSLMAKAAMAAKLYSSPGHHYKWALLVVAVVGLYGRNLIKLARHHYKIGSHL